MNNEQVAAVCKALTKAGQPCRALAMPGSEYCAIHEPAGRPPAGSAGIAGEATEPATGTGQRQRLGEEMKKLVRRVRSRSPEYEAPPYSPRRLVALVEEILERLPKSVQSDALERLRRMLREDLVDPEFWKGTWYMLNYTLKYQADLLKRRYTGDYETDDWGLDMEFVDAMRPVFAFLYKVYWRVHTTGIGNIPVEGPVVLVANHSGQVPWDSLMLSTAVLNEHPAGRLVRSLYGEVVPSLPVASHALVKLGQTLATEENGLRLLEQGEAVLIFPEGAQGIGKPIRDRYRLARFSQVPFARMALRAKAPIIAVSVVGAEETYLTLHESSLMARLTNLPYFPISPTFPWLGIMGLVPMPTQWAIDFGSPIATDGYGPDAASDVVLAQQITDQTRNGVLDLLEARLARRRSVFFG